MRRICASRLVFLDEFGCNRGMTRRYARGPRGARVKGYAPINYGSNISVIASMRQDGVGAAMRVEGATNGAVFLAFLRRFLLPTLRNGDLVIMDNLAAHKVDGVEDILAEVGARPLYLPPYSPDYNPIELCISKLKGFLRSAAARTKEDLDQALTQAFDAISPQETNAWVKHCGYSLLN